MFEPGSIVRALRGTDKVFCAAEYEVLGTYGSMLKIKPRGSGDSGAVFTDADNLELVPHAYRDEEPEPEPEPELEPVKYDDEKPRMDLVPPGALLACGRVMAFGARKYADWNWRGLDSARIYAALQRHALAWAEDPESKDPESGESHLVHAACCALMLLDKEQNSG